MNFFSTLFKYILFFSILIPIVALANNPPSLLTSRQYSVGLDLGVAKSTNLGNSTTFPLGYSTYSYSSSTHNVDALVSGISISKILTIAPLDTLQIGVSAHYISNMTAKGNLEQCISSYYQSTYFYHINSHQYLAEAILHHQFYDRYFPYIYLGLGIASNKAYNYSTTIPDYLTVTPEYSNKTTNSFTYSLGLGVDYFVIPRLSIGIGYRFINLGKVGLGPGVIRNTNVSAKLMQSNLYLNTFLAQLNYFI
jgi:opacity protein-like surface antigen